MLSAAAGLLTPMLAVCLSLPQIPYGKHILAKIEKLTGQQL
jgi:hypothetical protein